MARVVCQSCGMPMSDDAVKGSEADGSRSDKYCLHCYEKGSFTWPDATLEQMQTYCMGVLTRDKHWPSFLAKMATGGIAKLERWNPEKVA